MNVFTDEMFLVVNTYLPTKCLFTDEFDFANDIDFVGKAVFLKKKNIFADKISVGRTFTFTDETFVLFFIGKLLPTITLPTKIYFCQQKLFMPTEFTPFTDDTEFSVVRRVRLVGRLVGRIQNPPKRNKHRSLAPPWLVSDRDMAAQTLSLPSRKLKQCIWFGRQQMSLSETYN